MSTLIFYEKPGCANNARQKLLLKNAGHEVVAKNLLDEPWTAERLRAFFGGLPVPDWFNRAAPRVKSGEIVPERIDADTALALMLAEPLLIRRPLMECDEKRMAGFDTEHVADWIGAPLVRDEDGDLQTCQRDAK
jgi:nitrogenase-associated protein